MIWFTHSLANYNVYFTSNPKVTSPKTSTLTQRNSAHTFKTNMEYRHQLSAFDNVIIIIIVQELLQSNFHRLLKKLIYNSPSGSDDTIAWFLIEAKLVQATPRTDCTRRILSSNLVVDRGISQSFSHPSGANLHINFVSDRVNTCSNPSPKNRGRVSLPIYLQHLNCSSLTYSVSCVALQISARAGLFRSEYNEDRVRGSVQTSGSAERNSLRPCRYL